MESLHSNSITSGSAGGASTQKYVDVEEVRDGTIILNIINNSNETGCKISWDKKMVIQKLKAHSITTLKWDTSVINK